MQIASKHNIKLGEQHLSRVDLRLMPLIEEYGPCDITPHKDYYPALVSSIISQQLSVKAAASILDKFKALFGNDFPTPKEILATDTNKLRTAGLSGSKCNYINNLAQHIEDGSLNLNKLNLLSNTEVVRELTAVKGIGEWTAHMFMMFAMGRMDVLPHGDLGIKNGIEKMYGLGSLPTPKQVQDIATKNGWEPYESVASWYIWRSLDSK
jgi:DNA-3-methyladenine glycosylase II